MGFRSWEFGVNNLPRVPVLEVEIYSYRLYLFVHKKLGFLSLFVFELWNPKFSLHADSDRYPLTDTPWPYVLPCEVRSL